METRDCECEKRRGLEEGDVNLCIFVQKAATCYIKREGNDYIIMHISPNTGAGERR